jgi:hypothetical protein
MITIIERKPLFAFLVNWIKEWIRKEIIADGYEDDHGFHYDGMRHR